MYRPLGYARLGVAGVFMSLSLGLVAGSALAQTVTPEMRAMAQATARACRAEIRTYCGTVQPGGGRVFSCLQANDQRLTPACSDALARVMQAMPARQ